ncbi:MAG TPA: resistance-nodulation-cell division family transporter [Sulfurimonas sp. UBA12504]|nr:MAG: resistance-nodulation-cell division family transporter [Sulfurimonas sp. GWF2_37_8]DAB30058.1 MAG TPA: resistance-nodulation-cell division family transporter [Sulfurimonas sp. UBA12504]
MIKLIEYFIHNKRLNYALLAFLLYLGVHAYINIPKEMFPDVELDKIMVAGTYSGASASNMDKMAVRDLEDAIANINGIDKSETTITPGRFGIMLTLNEHADKINLLNKVKDAVAGSRQYLPSDMVEPIAILLDKSKSLLRISVASDTLSRGELTIIASDVKSKIARIKNISDVSIRGDSNEEVAIEINSEALLAYGLNPISVTEAISGLSYIYPIGDIEQKGNFVFVSTVNGKTDAKEYEDAILKIDAKYIRLGDIAKVNIYYPQTQTLTTFNNKPTLTLVVSKAEEGNSIELSKDLRQYIEKVSKNYPGVAFSFSQDSSKPIKDRLNIVISNLMFGLILVFISMYILINIRIAFIVTMGIPFSFIIGLLFIYYMGYSINIVSLLGALIVIGIVVDDAIVVGENIQRHIDEGMEAHEAAVVGLKEVILPVTLATLTTAAAFLPMFMMTGEIALFLVLVPIVVVIILFGSLIESFFFLPLHAKELLKKTKPIVDWEPLQNFYEKILYFHIKYKKSFVVMFLVLIPILTVVTAQSMKFQFFPNFDGNNLYISGKLDINTPLEDTFTIAKEIEAELMQHGQEFSFKSTSASSGYRRTLSGDTENNNNVFFITMELYDREDIGFINRYLNPLLNFSFDFNDPEKMRLKQTFELSPRAAAIIEKYKEKYNLLELGVMEDKPGLIRSDIQINLSGKNDKELEAAIKIIEEKLSTIQGVANFSDNIKYGKMEYKIKINSFGESLGLSEASVAKILSKYFLEARQSTTFNEQGVMEIKTFDAQKDNIQTLLDFSIALPDGRFVKLTDIAEIIKIRDYEKIDKLNGSIVKTVFANVDKRSITPQEILSKLEETLQEISLKGIEVDLLGEKEKNKQLQGDMKKTVLLALFLIFLTLLLIFSKVKYVLMVMSVIPLSILGALVGHKFLGMPLTMPSIIGILGLSGVVINDGILMLDFLKGTHRAEEFFKRAKLRLRPILITSITTFLGLYTLIFYASGQAVILQPIAISIGFGLVWGTFLNLIYLPTLFAVVNSIDPNREVDTARPKAKI